MFRLIRRGVFFGIGMKEKARELAEELMIRGEKSEGKTAKLVKEMADKGEKSLEDLKKRFCDLACKGAEQVHIPTRSDLDRIEKGLNDLSARLGRIEERG